MEYKNNIEEMESFFLEAFRNHTIQLILGAGFTKGAKAKNGIVPSGEELKELMINELSKNEGINRSDLERLTFKEVAGYFEDDELIDSRFRRQFYKDHFSDVNDIAESKKQFLEIDWSYVYSLNIDDAIEKNSEYKHIVYSNRMVDDQIYDDYKCVVKLHGDISDMITYQDSSCKIFTDKEYIKSITNNKSLLRRLEHDFNFFNIVFVGCSLSDELDIASLDLYPYSDDRKNKRKIIFSQNKFDKLKEKKLERYGITDVILIKDYEEIYEKLYKIFIEAKKTRSSDLEHLRNLNVKYLNYNETPDKYFYYGTYLYRPYTLTIPHFFISRDISIENKSGVFVFQGNSVSGKSYLLIDLFLKQKGKKQYFISSTTRLNDDAVSFLIKEEEINVYFDTGALTRSQFQEILDSAETIKNNMSSFIFAIDFKNRDFIGILTRYEREKKLLKSSFYLDTLSSKFSLQEIKTLNKKLSILGISYFNEEYSLIDNLIRIQRYEVKQGRFAKTALKFSNISLQMLELYILLGTKEKLYSQEVMDFSLLSEMGLFMNLYREFIDIEPTKNFEITASKNSPEKYVLNAKLWLRSELANFASDENNLILISEAYTNIIRKIKENYSSEEDYYRERDLYRDFTLFDTIDSVFSIKKKRNKKFIISLYEKLFTELSNDYQFLHQYAKAYFEYYSMLDNNDIEEKDGILDSAWKKINIACSMVEEVIRTKKRLAQDSDNNEMTFAHMRFTKVLIECEKMVLHDFDNISDLGDLIRRLCEVINHPYNDQNIQRKYYNQTLSKFLSKCFSLELSKNQRDSLNDLQNFLFSHIRETY